MALDRYLDFDSYFFTKYASLAYYLSKGASGNVYGPIPWNDMQLAVKQVTFADGEVTKEFKKDIEVKKNIWTSLEHKHLTRIRSVDLSQLPKVLFIVMEYAAGGSLSKTLRSLGTENKLPIDVVTDWAKQIAEGMLYLHRKKIVHRDLKSSNIVLMEPFSTCNSHTKLTLKIADFDEVKEHHHTTTMSFVGTCAYMAPEVIINQRFSKASDVWSYGVVLWEMLSGDIPYKGWEPRNIIHKSIIGELDNLPLEQSFPDYFKLLLKRCWKSTCRERPSFPEIFFSLQRKDGLLEKYQSDPVLIAEIRKKNASASINGATILDNELFVVSENISVIEVYDSIKFRFSRVWNLKELLHPCDIGSCHKNKCLYIFDWKFDGQPNEILRVDRNGKLIKNWSTGDDDGWGLSVTDESTVILSVHTKNILIEYSPDGQLIRKINLSSEADIRCPWHAIKLTNGHFVVSHGSDYDVDEQRVSLVDADGKLVKSFSGKPGSSIGKLKSPYNFSVDGKGFVLVVDQDDRRVLLLDPDLKFNREILWIEKHELRSPRRILLDEPNGRMLVADNIRSNGGRILIFRDASACSFLYDLVELPDEDLDS